VAWSYSGTGGQALAARAEIAGADIPAPAAVIAGATRPAGDIKKSFEAAARAAGLTEVTPHTLRHTAGVWMARGGAPLWQVAGQLGHSFQRTTELYAHHHPDHLGQAVEALDRTYPERERYGNQAAEDDSEDGQERAG